jgi:hypothetical protein
MSIEENAFFFALGGNDEAAKAELNKLSPAELAVMEDALDDLVDLIRKVRTEKK